MAKKRFLIDTSVIIDNPSQNLHSLYQNGDNEIYITEIVLHELDKHKISMNHEVGVAARTFFRAVSEEPFKESSKKKKHVLEGDKIYQTKLKFDNIPESIKVYIVNRPRNKYRASHSDPNDLKILEIAKDYGMKLITNDVSFKVIAMSEGVAAESLKMDSVMSPESITFAKEVEVKENEKEKMINSLGETEHKWNQITLKEVAEDEENGKYETGRKSFYIVNGIGLIPIRSNQEDFEELIVKPINMEQKFYAEMLQMPFNILTVTGSTGSGKTLLAVQEAIRQVKSPDSPIDGIIYMRYTVNTTDKHAELGFRAGDENQKLGYFNYPLYSAINFLIEKEMEKRNMGEKAIEEARKSGINKSDETESFMKEHNIVVTDIAHARGITIANKFVIFDEVQNAPNSILQLIGTRIGDNSKIVLMGDFRQVDHPYLSKTRNALVTLLRLAEKGDPMLAAIQLRSTVRSEVAEWFQENLK
jgi:PhoH-like ATPase